MKHMERVQRWMLWWVTICHQYQSKVREYVQYIASTCRLVALGASSPTFLVPRGSLAVPQTYLTASLFFSYLLFLFLVSFDAVPRTLQGSYILASILRFVSESLDGHFKVPPGRCL